MAYAVELSKQAARDVEAIVDYLALGSGARGAAFVEELLERVRNKIGMFPLSGTAVGRYRFTVFSGYVVVYAIDEAASRVILVLVTEGHRDWRTLLESR